MSDDVPAQLSLFLFFKQKTAYEIVSRDWSSDVCSSDLTCVLVVASFPLWLPKGVVALRMRVFAHLNGHEGIPVPGDLVGAAQFKEVYSHPAANGRSRGAGLSDLFWYWLSPGAELH